VQLCFMMQNKLREYAPFDMMAETTELQDKLHWNSEYFLH